MENRVAGFFIEIQQDTRKRNAAGRPSDSEIPDDPLNV
jgi:hypothetical protein